MNKYYIFFVLFWIISIPYVAAQNITFAVSENLQICQTTELKLVIKNTTGMAINNADIIINMPCGTAYNLGSIKGATEKTISNLSAPIFRLENINPGQEVELIINVSLNCAALPCLDAQQLFVFKATLSFGNTSKEFTSAPINTDSPNLVITGIDNTYDEIPSFTSKIRKVTIRNSRIGRTNRFVYRHTYDPYIDVNANKGRLISKTSTQLELSFDSLEFKKIGNGDAWFDFNESIEINENILVTACSYDQQFVRSDYVVTWGCNNTVCQQNSAIANVFITENNDIGNKFTMTTTGIEPLCYKNGTAEQKILINKASHKNTLTDIKFRIDQPYLGRGILEGSVVADFADEIKYFDYFINDCGLKVAKYAIIYKAKFERANFELVYEIKWLTSFCESSICGTPSNAWTANLQYRKECSSAGDSNFNINIDHKNIKTPAFVVNNSLTDKNGRKVDQSILKDSLEGFLIFDFKSDHFLTNANDSLKIRIEIPQGIEIKTQDFILGGKSPVRIIPSQGPRNRIYVLIYILPFSSDIVKMTIPFVFNCKKVLPPEKCEENYASCICDEKVFDKVLLKGTLQLDEECMEGYLPMVCSELLYQIKCDNIKPCYQDTLDGSFGYIGNLSRTSYGKVDIDNDNLADTDTLTPRPDKYKLNHFVAGDSFDLTFNGAIVVDKPGSIFTNLTLKIRNTQFKTLNNSSFEEFKDLLLGSDGAIKTYRKKIRIRQKSTGNVYTFENVNELKIDDSYYYHLSADSLRWYNTGTDFPPNFKYSEGDSVFMLISKYIDINVFKQNPDKVQLEQHIQFNYNFNSFVGNTPETTFETSPCDCYFPYVFFPEFLINATKEGTNVIHITNPKICNTEFITTELFRINYGNKKVYDPPISQVFPFEIRESIKPLSLEVTKIDEIELGDLRVTYLGKIFNFSPIDIGDKLIYDFKNLVPPSGSHDGGHILIMGIKIRPRKCVNLLKVKLTEYKVKFIRNELGKLYFPDSLVRQVQFSFDKGKINTFIYQKELTAFSNRFKAGFSVIGPEFVSDIDHMFIKVKNPSGSIADFKIKDTVTQEVFEPKNGYFQLGLIKTNGKRHFELTGVSQSCGSDIIILEYGFDCGPYENPAFQPCFQAMDTFKINFPDGLVDMIIKQPENPFIQLCDTLTQEATFLNAGLGNAYDMKIQLRLPPGTQYVSGSGFMYFPARQRVTGWPLPDPVLNNAQNPEWSLNSFWPAHLSDGLAGAGFFPDNEFDITYKAVTDCNFTSGLPILYNINAKKGCGTITNSVTKNSPALNLQGVVAIDPITISGTLQLSGACSRDEAELNISFPKPSVDNTTLILQLPPDWEIITGTVTGNLPVLTPIKDNKFYTWNITGNNPIFNLNLKIKNRGSLLCLSDLISIYISDRASVNCLANGQPCEVGNVAGIIAIPLEISQTTFAIDKIKLEKRNGQQNLYTEVTQTSGIWYGPLNGIIFIDDNENNTLDASEKQITSIVYSGINPNNKTVGQWINLSNISESDYCRLTLYIPKEQNCICEDIILPLNREIEIYNNDLNLCSNGVTTIGTTDVPGTSYQWNQADGLSCTQCSNTTFSIVNNQTNPLFFTKKLTATNGSCLTTYQFNITVNPLPKLLTNPLTICKGDTIKAITTAGVTYSWIGSGIIQGDNQVLIAKPESSTSYQVTITDGLGCMGTGNLDVTVITLPEYEVLSDTIFCKDTSADLNVRLTNADFFIWNKGTNRLDNTNTLNPQITVFENFVFGLEIRNGKCKKTVDIPVQFYNVGTGSEEVEICEGSSYTFNNQILTSSGKYCKTEISKMGCDSSFCITLNIRPLPEITTLPDSITKDRDIDLQITGPGSFVSYQWSPPTSLSCTTCPNPITSTADTITYTVEVIDEIGCRTSSKVKILIQDRCESENAKIPNAFSPNDDGVNDFFTLGKVALCELSIKVFNRWGNLVYEQSNWDNKWDGRSQNGLPLPQGTYFVQLEFAGTGIIRSTMVDLRKK